MIARKPQRDNKYGDLSRVVSRMLLCATNGAATYFNHPVNYVTVMLKLIKTVVSVIEECIQLFIIRLLNIRYTYLPGLNNLGVCPRIYTAILLIRAHIVDRGVVDN